MNSDEQPDEFERYQHRDPCRDHSGPIRPGRSDTELVIDLLSFPYTDTGNAERLVAMYGDLIRFCPERRKWLIWDGKRWNSEDTRRVKMLMKRTTRMMFAQAAEIADKELRTAAEKFARRSESAAAISAALTCAEYEDGVPIRARELDSHRLLINFQNGTFDFETSRLREHRREDLLTKIVHFPYNPDATCPIFTAFNRIAGDGPGASERDRERAERVVRYIQKCIGYAMTGDVSEKVIFFLFGHGSSSQADLADLHGARFVTTSEADQGKRLAIGKLKYLTQGMGEIKSCRKYENPITFPATHKLILDANHRPVVRASEKAAWNRFRPIPFTVEIPEAEKDLWLLDKLKSEAEGILAWAVEGCLRWRREGVGQLPEVADEAAGWQSESDPLASFLAERYVVNGRDTTLSVGITALRSEYEIWCGASGEDPVAKPVFNQELEALGLKRGVRGGGKVRVWIGIRRKTDLDQAGSGDKVTEGDVVL